MVRDLELKDITRFVSVTDIDLSPDLDKIAFVATKADEKLDDYLATIWVVDRANGEPITYFGGKKNFSPRWSPDGKRLLFLPRRTMKEDERGFGIWVTSR